MLTSLGSTANSDVTYMMIDFLSGNCTATSEREGGQDGGREVDAGQKDQRYKLSMTSRWEGVGDKEVKIA